MADKNFVYRPPLFFKNGHVQTVFPTLFRKFDSSFYVRERIYTPDKDFLDLDWSSVGSDGLAIISHGLEGNSYRPYVIGMVKALNNSGWDALAWNYRTCSGETNRQLRMYHNGTTDDLDLVVKHAAEIKKYKSIALIGFSMGGNLSLIYLGEKGDKVDPLIKCAVVFSVPCDLEESSYQLAKPVNRIYMKRFLILLHKKVKAKMEVMPDRINDHNYHLIKNFKDFDDRYTAPIHGFKNAEDYWRKCSSRFFIHKIKVKTLIVNAENDPFLGRKCYPYKEVSGNKYISMEVPASGGHVGFIEFNKERLYWSEKRAIAFLNGE